MNKMEIFLQGGGFRDPWPGNIKVRGESRDPAREVGIVVTGSFQLGKPQTLTNFTSHKILTFLDNKPEDCIRWEVRICRNHYEREPVGGWIRGVLSGRITSDLTRSPPHLAPLPPFANDASIPHCTDILCARTTREYHTAGSDRSCVQLSR